jgi:hypothetical protein
MKKIAKKSAIKKKSKASRIVDTHLSKERMKDADQLEKQRLMILRELEDAMAEYADLTGYKRLKSRQHKVGSAPNDWIKR